MFFPYLFPLLALLATANPVPQGGIPYPTGPCTDAKRRGIAMTIIGAFNDPDPVRSAATLQNAPFKPDGTIEFCINGAPCARVGYDAQTSKLAAIAARQAVGHVDTIFSSYPNGTVVMDAVVTFGVGALGVPFPVKTKIYVPGDFDLVDCRIIDLPAYFTLPSEVAGIPINPPFLSELGIPAISPVLPG